MMTSLPCDNSLADCQKECQTMQPIITPGSATTASTTKSAQLSILPKSAPSSSSKQSGSRTNISAEPKFRCNITSERIAQLRKQVDDAIRDHRTFTIKGGWQTLRTALLFRHWVEKYESNATNKRKVSKDMPSQLMEEVVINLPAKLDWESITSYTLKCERTIMSRMLQNHCVDFYWNMRRDLGDWHHRVNTHQLMNRFGYSFFTSKEGLNLLLQQPQWFCEPGISRITFPRCYTLGKGFTDHYDKFLDDFRITACMGMLKWLTYKYENEDEYAIKSHDGQVPFTAFQFALDRCNDFIASEKHLDLDREPIQILQQDWDQFLEHCDLILHKNALFIESKQWVLPLNNAAAKTTLAVIGKYWPMLNLDGMGNIWILKPGNKCRGRGIQLITRLEPVSKAKTAKLKYVVQKYIERPLLIHKTKFDIRQWFMITSAQPLILWMYKESYLRFSTQLFNLENFHESLHLTNHAVQCKYTNVPQRDKALPEQNMWDSHTFKVYLRQIGHDTVWDEIIYPGMRENLIGAILACQDAMDRRANTFELYGADFMLGEDFKPWLLEINSSPDLSPSTNVTSRLCPQVLQDVIRVVVDKRRDANADTGNFEMIYKQNLPRPPAYLGMSLNIRGRRIFNKNKRSKTKEMENVDANNPSAPTVYASLISKEIIPQCVPKILSPGIYNGPMIEDLIEEINQSIFPKGAGYEFVPSIRSMPHPPKKKIEIEKKGRVQKIVNSFSKPNKSDFNRKVNEKGSNKTAKESERRKPHQGNAFGRNYLGLYKEWNAKNKFLLKYDIHIGSNSSVCDDPCINKKTIVARSNNVVKHRTYSLPSINLSNSLAKLGSNYKPRT